MEVDLFGNVIEKKVLLRETFIEPPFSVIDSKSGTWQARKRKWKNLGIKSEVGRDAVSIHIGTKANSDEGSEYTSIFDPALCELMYRWFCPEGGSILDPFAGGSVRGIVANYLGYKYTGIDIREEQIASNIEQGKEILGDDICEWITGDSNKVLDSISNNQFDMVFSCPPYADLEVYSDLDGDISNMDYPHFIDAYRSIIKKSIDKLVGGGVCSICSWRSAWKEWMLSWFCPRYDKSIYGLWYAIL